MIIYCIGFLKAHELGLSQTNRYRSTWWSSSYLIFPSNFDTWSHNWFECYFEVKRSYFVWLLLRKNVAKTKNFTKTLQPKLFTGAIGRHRIQVLLAPISLQLGSDCVGLFFGVHDTTRRCQFEIRILCDKKWFIGNWSPSLRRTLPQRRRDLQT